MQVGKFVGPYGFGGFTGRQLRVRATTADISISVANGNPGSPFVTRSILSFSSYDISSARMSPHVGSDNARPCDEAMHGATPTGPSKSGDCPVGMLAITFGGFVVRSNTTTVLLAFPTNIVLPSAVTMTPHGHDSGFTPLALAAQHCAPVNPPNRPLGPNPGSEKPIVRQPNLVNAGEPPKVPASDTNGGMIGRHALALFPACATSFAPPMVFTAMLLMVSTTTTSRPIRSDT